MRAAALSATLNPLINEFELKWAFATKNEYLVPCSSSVGSIVKGKGIYNPADLYKCTHTGIAGVHVSYLYQVLVLAPYWSTTEGRNERGEREKQIGPRTGNCY